MDSAAKAGFLHDIGHHTWYEMENGIMICIDKMISMQLKGAERAHKLLIRLGENPIKAKEISLAILFHTDSYFPGGEIVRTPLQAIIKQADEKDEEPGGTHHYRKIEQNRAYRLLERLDHKIDEVQANTSCKCPVHAGALLFAF